MTMREYLKSRGLTVSLVANKLGISRQSLSQYGHGRYPQAKTLAKVAKAMTELEVPTTVGELAAALYPEED